MVRPPTRLARAHIPNHFIALPSPATPHSHRLAVQPASQLDSCHVYLASGSHIYYLKIEIPDSDVLQGKESLLVPSDARILETSKLASCPHRAEVQCVTLYAPSSYEEKHLLASVDSYGLLIVSELDSFNKGSSYTVSVPDPGAGEGGWAGCVFFPQQPSMVAVARGFAKSVDLYDKDMHVRSFQTLQFPTAITFLDENVYGSSMLALAEGPQLSIWDLRAGEKGGCVQRVPGSFTGECLYTVASRDGLLGTGGADRSITVFDIKRWTPRSRWVNALKYEVTGMAFSVAKRNFIFAYGLDYEVAGGEWEGDEVEGTIQRSFGFRGDSRWLGMDKCGGTDLMVGWSENGSIFVAHWA